MLFRTHFEANGKETIFSVETQGGSAYASSVWINETFIGSWPGEAGTSSFYQNLTLPKLTSGELYTFTVLQDTMGQEESGPVGPGSLVSTTPFSLFCKVEKNLARQSGKYILRYL